MNGIYWYNCIDKSKKHKGNLWMIAVVPRAGTWIETPTRRFTHSHHFPSFPVRERGLKHLYRSFYLLEKKSFPVRERGLKPEIYSRNLSRV